METKQIIDILIKNFNLGFWEEFEGTHLLSNQILKVMLIEPHEGTDYKFILRADYPETFDRWSVCLYEESFIAEDFSLVLEDFCDFVENREENIEEELGEN